jgi:c-di-GMP-binding flagellar brake protein YcgR
MQQVNAKADPEMHQGTTQDISLGGICLRGEKGMLAVPLAQGSFLDMLIDLAGQWVHCVGTVVWFKRSAEGGFYAGVAFMGLDEASLSRVEGSIASILKGSSI